MNTRSRNVCFLFSRLGFVAATSLVALIVQFLIYGLLLEVTMHVCWRMGRQAQANIHVRRLDAGPDAGMIPRAVNDILSVCCCCCCCLVVVVVVVVVCCCCCSLATAFVAWCSLLPSPFNFGIVLLLTLTIYVCMICFCARDINGSVAQFPDALHRACELPANLQRGRLGLIRYFSAAVLCVSFAPFRNA